MREPVTTIAFELLSLAVAPVAVVTWPVTPKMEQAISNQRRNRGLLLH
jgi:hypothetical protein